MTKATLRKSEPVAQLTVQDGAARLKQPVRRSRLMADRLELAVAMRQTGSLAESVYCLIIDMPQKRH
jgi:hypothetical protein